MIAPPDHVIRAAVEAGARSSCAKSKRGAAVFDPRSGTIPGVGWNGPPEPFACTGSEACCAACGKLCVHAEQRAIRDAIRWPSVRMERRGPGGLVATLRGFELAHAKVVDGQLVAGGGPSCWQCSREILDVGLAAVWLYEFDESNPASAALHGKGRWRYYTAEEFHHATAAHPRNRLPLEVRR